MIWAKLLFLLIFFDVIQASTRSCAQCVAGNFLFRRNLMQDSMIGMSMGWVQEWKGTDCFKGTVNTIPCDHACLKITILQHPLEENAVEGIMMDCSDMLIYASPDLPRDIDFKAYDETATFSAKRRNFTITYDFTMEGFHSVEKIREDHASIVLPYYREDYSISTIITHIVISSVAVFLCAGWCCHTIFYKKKFREYVRSYPVSQRQLEERIELEEDPANTSDSDVTSSAPSAPTDDSGSHHEEIHEEINDDHEEKNVKVIN